MKSYTDLNQSKKLAEFLPTESADNFHIIGYLHTDGPRYEVIRPRNEVGEPEKYWPCWSLAALLDIIPAKLNGYKDMVIRLRMDKGDAGSDEYNLWYEDISTGVATSLDVEADNFVDACCEMIINLHEQKLL